MQLNRNSPTEQTTQRSQRLSTSSSSSSTQSPVPVSARAAALALAQAPTKLSPNATSTTTSSINSSSEKLTRTGSTISLYSTNSTYVLTATPNTVNTEKCYHQRYHPKYQSRFSGCLGNEPSCGSAISSVDCGGENAGNPLGRDRHGRDAASRSARRSKKLNWGSRERAGMSFLIVIAFFTIFGIIILTELFMIDERTHGNVMIYRRDSELLPDYNSRADYLDSMDSYKVEGLSYQGLSNGAEGENNRGIGRFAGMLINSGGNTGDGRLGFGGLNAAGLTNAQSKFGGKIIPPVVERTLPPYPLGKNATDATWQVVNGTRFKFFVYAAYYDNRNKGRMVRIIGATSTREPDHVWCRLWWRNKNEGRDKSIADSATTTAGEYSVLTVMAKVKMIHEHFSLKYSACFVICPLFREIPIPEHVSVVARLRLPTGNLLRVRNAPWDEDFRMPVIPSKPLLSLSSSPLELTKKPPIDVATMPRTTPIPDGIAVCIKPLHYDYDKAMHLIEFLEFYGLLGATRFTFYNHTIGPHANCVLRHYIDGNVPGDLTAQDEMILSSKYKIQNKSKPGEVVENITHTVRSHYVRPSVSSLEWDLRMRSQKEIRTEGLFASLNDCLYRSMYRNKYVVLIDLDEFIIPRKEDTLNDLIRSLNERKKRSGVNTDQFGCYYFQNAFFYLQFPDAKLTYKDGEDELTLQIRADLVTQKKTRRRHQLHPHKQRSKYICRPEAVVEAGNHFIWEFSGGKFALNVRQDDALMHHYRVCEFGGDDCINWGNIDDRNATRYSNRLVERVERVYKHLKDTCKLPDLQKLPENILAKIRSTTEGKKEKNNNTSIVGAGTAPTAAPNTTIASTNKPKTLAKPNTNLAKPNSSAITTSGGVTLSGMSLTVPKMQLLLAKPPTVAMNATMASRNATVGIRPVLNATTVSGDKVLARTTRGTSTSTSTTVMPRWMSQRKRHKVVVFEQGDTGSPVIRMEYV